LKVTLIAQLAPAATLDPQLLVSAKSPALAPDTATLVTLNAAFPELLSVIVCPALAAPTVWLANVRLVGERLTADVIPVPATLTLWGLWETLSVTVTCAVRVPDAVGWKVTVIVQLAPAAMVDPQLLLCAKSLGFVPPSVMPEMFTVELPTFATMFVWAALVVPTAWLPKVTVAGLTESPIVVAGSAIALPPAPPPQDVAKVAKAMQAMASIIAVPRSSFCFPALMNMLLLNSGTTKLPVSHSEVYSTQVLSLDV
jgi:hypothetical protein